MSIKKISKLVETFQYETSDGKKFTSEKEAENHERYLDNPDFYSLDINIYDPDRDYKLEDFLDIAQKLCDTYGKSAIIRHDSGHENMSVAIATMSYKGNPL